MYNLSKCYDKIATNNFLSFTNRYDMSQKAWNRNETFRLIFLRHDVLIKVSKQTITEDAFKPESHAPPPPHYIFTNSLTYKVL